MGEETRDIAIQTRADLKNLSEQVAKLTGLVEDLNEAMTERRGAEKVARWLIAGGAGTASAIVTKFGGAIFGLPIPK